MSYEGYDRFLCKNGHLWELDAYKTMYNEDKQKCPTCGEEEVWNESVDETNGEGVATVLKLDNERSKICGECKSLLKAVYKIPNKDKKQPLEICHVCGKEKEPYIVILDDDILSFIHYERARENGPICERCDKYFAMTGEFKDATDEEFEIAKESVKFARMMLKWWEKDKKIDSGDADDIYSTPDDDANKRDWGGLVSISKWYRDNKENDVVDKQ